MSDEPEKKLPKGNVRRVGKDAQKDKLDKRDLSFPPSTPMPPEHTRFAPPDVAPQLPTLPDDDVEQLIPTTRGKVVTPPEERFPPIAPPRDLPEAIQQSKTLYPERNAPAEQPVAPQPKNRMRNVLANLLTALLMLLMLGAVAFFVYVWQNPYSPMNPLALPTPLPVVITATFLPPTDTPNPTTAPTMTFTPLAAAELDATPTPLGQIAPQVTPTLPNGALLGQNTPVPLLDYPFISNERDKVIYQPNQNGRGCEWASIAGDVVGLNGEPLDGIAVRITATYPDAMITEDYETVYTGSTLSFGAGGFERQIGEAPPDEANPYWVQLFNAGGLPLSTPYMVITSTQCDQNVVLITFTQIEAY